MLPLSQNTALFSLLGTTYGGDGKSNFALPGLMGSAPMLRGQGPGLSLYDEGQTGGSDTVTLLESEIPAHPHFVRGIRQMLVTIQLRRRRLSLAKSNNGQAYQTAVTNLTQMNPKP